MDTPDAADYPHDSVAALLYTQDGRYVLQHRDDDPAISFPGMWGLFGGAVEAGEAPLDALRRELAEELMYVPTRIKAFCLSRFSFAQPALAATRRRYYAIPVEEATLTAFVLGEGQALAAFSVADVLARAAHVVPFDLCATMMHARVCAAPDGDPT